MARVEQPTVSSTKAYEVTGPDGAVITVQNLGPDSCFYATASTVSSGSNDGTLTSGSTLPVFAPSKFFISSGTSKLQVTTTPAGEVASRGATGRLVMAPDYLVGATATIATASRAYMVRFVPTFDFVATAIAWEVTVAATNDDACDVGLYTAAGAKIVTAGATTGKMNATTGVKSITITSTPLLAGTAYYAGLSYGTVGGTAATLRTTSSGNAGELHGATVGTALQFAMAAAHPLPTAVTFATSSATPILAVRGA